MQQLPESHRQWEGGRWPGGMTDITDVLFIYNFNKNKRNSFQSSSLSIKWFYITLPSCHCYQDSAQTFPLLRVLCREVSSAMWLVLENYHPEHALLLLCTGPLTGTLACNKMMGFLPHMPCPRLPFCLARLSLFVDRNNAHQPVNRQSGALLPNSAQPLSSDTAERRSARRQSRYVALQRNTN